MVEDSKDYHDYVFRDGKLVGEFEAMYRNSEGTPWHQDEQENWVDVRLTTEMLRDVEPFTEIHDLGCGLGHYLAIMRRAVGANAYECYGYDIAETACVKARKIWPSFKFFQFDLTSAPAQKNATRQKQEARSKTVVYHPRNAVVCFPQA